MATLTSYDWIYGIAQITAVSLSIIAGAIAISLFRNSQTQTLRAWNYLIIGLILFTIEEILGGLRTFGVWNPGFLTHVVPSLILTFIITSLVAQINVNRGWMK